MRMSHLPSCLKGPLFSPLLPECEYQFYLKGDRIPCLSAFEFHRGCNYTHGLDHQNSHRDIPALPFCKVTLKAQKPAPDAYPKKLKTLGDHLRKKRLDLKLLQKEVAQKLGVDEATICNWENNRSSSSLCYIPKIVEFLGYVPDCIKANTLGKRITTLRKLLGITQKELAHRLGVDPGTLACWERDKSNPHKRLLTKLNVLLGKYLRA